MYEYNYMESVKSSVSDYINNEINKEDYIENREGLENYLNDELFTSDSVTGNGSGSYFFNSYKAEEALCHNLDLLKEALENFGCGIEYLEKGAEACDVTIRCYLLPQTICEVLDELEETGYFEEEENTED